MKICFLLISEGWGGAETVVHDLIVQLQKNDVEVYLILNEEISNYFNDINVEKLNLGSVFHTPSLFKMILKPENPQITNKQYPVPLINFFLMRILLKRIRSKLLRFLHDNDVILLHSHLEYADILGHTLKNEKSDKFKWITSLHGHWFSLLQQDFSIPFLGDRYSINFLKNAFETADAVLFPSSYLQKEFHEIIKIPNHDSVVIPNGIDIDEINFKTLKNSRSDYKFHIFFPGGPKLTKGGDILIKSLNLIKDKVPFELSIALDVPQDHIIRQLIKQYDLESNVNFMGFLNKKEYYNVLNSSDVMALPSRVESFGLAYLEAMALGIPVIGTKTTGAAEIISNYRNGILVDPTPEDVADAILTLYGDDDLRKKISSNNVDDVRKFDWGQIVKVYIKLYNRILNSLND